MKSPSFATSQGSGSRESQPFVNAAMTSRWPFGNSAYITSCSVSKALPILFSCTEPGGSPPPRLLWPENAGRRSNERM